MKMMPMMSSRIARASRKTRTREGSPLPNIASTPSANAISVAVGMGQPGAVVLSPPAISRYTAIGTSTPPVAAMAGCTALRGESSSPWVSSWRSSDGHHQEEDGEKPIGHPVRDRQIQGGAGDRDVEIEEGGERVVRRQIREQEAEAGRDEEEDGGELLPAEGVR